MRSVNKTSGVLLATLLVLIAAPAASAHPGQRFPSDVVSVIEGPMKKQAGYSSVTCRLADQRHHVVCVLIRRKDGVELTITSHCVNGGILNVLAHGRHILKQERVPVHLCR